MKKLFFNIKKSGIVNSVLFFLKLLMAKLTDKRLPLTVIYNITDNCNLKCAYCYAGYNKRRINEPSKEDIFLVIDQLLKLGTKRISLSGGEPLMRSDIGEIIDYIKSKNLLCALNSNGILLPLKIKEIKNIDILCLSLDGDKDAHDYYRGQGSFERVIGAIECAKQNGLKIYTNTVLHAKNLESIDFIMELARRNGIGAEFAILIGHIYEEGKENDLRKATNEQYKLAIKKIIDYKKKGYPVVISEKAYSYTALWADYGKENFKINEIPDFPHIKCNMAGKYFSCIDTDGKMYACPHLIGKQAAISCYNYSAKEAFYKISAPDCHACYQVYHNEFNLLFNLDLDVMINYVKNTFN